MKDDDAPMLFFCGGPDRHAWGDPDDAAKCCNGFIRLPRVTKDGNGINHLDFFWQATDSEARDAGSVEAYGEGARQSPAVAALGTSATLGLRMLPHAGFWTRLSKTGDELSPRWKALCAGLLTLRFVDHYVMGRGHAPAPSLRELHHARSAVDELDSGPMQNALCDLLDAAPGIDDHTTQSVPDLLYRFARLLEDEGEWEVAIDVYDTVIEHAPQLGRHAVIPKTFTRIASCHRQLGELVKAAQALRKGRRAARRLKDVEAELLVRVAQANLTAHRGDAALAKRQLDAVVALAKQRDLHDPLARALHDLGALALYAGQFDEAVPDLWEAYDLYDDAELRERALSDLAFAAGNLGWRDAARDAFTLIFHKPIRHEQRLTAACNLMMMAAEDRDYSGFRRYRELLGKETMPAALQAWVYETEAEGFLLLGHRSVAEQAYLTLEEFALSHGLGEFVTRAHTGLSTLEPPEPRPNVSVPTWAEPVAHALREQRMGLANAG